MKEMREICLDHFNGWLKESEYRGNEIAYEVALKYVADLPKEESDLQQLVEDIEAKYSGERLFPYFGIFVSAAVNQSGDEGIKLTIKNPKLSYLGLNNNNELTIIGNVGNFIGESMNGGKLTIEGNTDFFTGSEMQGGHIILKGNSMGHLGSMMNDGTITVHGNVLGEIATMAEGGTVELLGDYKSICPLTKAKVYHNGNLVELK